MCPRESDSPNPQPHQGDNSCFTPPGPRAEAAVWVAARPGHRRPHLPWLRLGSAASAESAVHPRPEAAATHSTPLPESKAATASKDETSKRRRPGKYGRRGRELGRKTVVKGASRRGRARSLTPGAEGEHDFRLADAREARLLPGLKGGASLCFAVCLRAKGIRKFLPGRILGETSKKKYCVAFFRTVFLPLSPSPSICHLFCLSLSRVMISLNTP